MVVRSGVARLAVVAQLPFPLAKCNEAFLATVDVTPANLVSACQGWTTHEVAAHVTGIAVEVTRHLDSYLAGDPVPQTRSFEEREAPLWALSHPEMLARLDREEVRMRSVVADVLDREPDAVIPWTGRQMSVAKFLAHLRHEHALHRWDLAGDDEISRRLLGSPSLVDHFVGELGQRVICSSGADVRTPAAESAATSLSPT